MLCHGKCRVNSNVAIEERLLWTWLLILFMLWSWLRGTESLNESNVFFPFDVDWSTSVGTMPREKGQVKTERESTWDTWYPGSQMNIVAWLWVKHTHRDFLERSPMGSYPCTGIKSQNVNRWAGLYEDAGKDRKFRNITLYYVWSTSEKPGRFGRNTFFSRSTYISKI